MTAPQDPRVNYKPLRALTLEAWRAAGMAGAKRKLRYVDEALSLRCTTDLLTAGLFPSTAAMKEITESFAAFNAARNHVQWTDPRDEKTTVVVVGDGGTPRTAALFALRSRWSCFSVDPALAARRYEIQRLSLCPYLAEDVRLGVKGDVVLVAVHSHASFEAALSTVPLASRVAYVCIPCCVAKALAPFRPDEVYEDEGILSPDRRVYVWNDVRR